MGVSLREIAELFASENLSTARGLRVLDIGCSNLYEGAPGEYEQFLTSYGNVVAGQELRDFCEILSLGAKRHPVAGGLNGAWLGELLERAGCEYVAYDIFHGFMTTIFDLNRSAVPPVHRGYFDMVINCGTTEHVLNQLNCFRVIHDATKAGGVMLHALPMIGYLDHGYFSYNPRLFVELAEANGYEIRFLDYPGPGLGPTVFDRIVAPYADLNILNTAELKQRWRAKKIPNAGIRIILRKSSERPFRAPLETSTTVGGMAAVPADVQTADQIVELQARAQRMIDRSTPASLAELEALLIDFQQHHVVSAFPRQLERQMLNLYLQAHPSQRKWRDRLAQLERSETADIPLVRVPSDGATNVSAMLDGVESHIDEIKKKDERYRAIIHCYHAYVAAGRATDFPLRLEMEGLQRAVIEFPEDYDLIIRLGKVAAAILARLPLTLKSRT